MTTRRELMQWTAASLGVIASDLARATDDELPKPLSILFLGGTGFLGPVQVEYALARGHRVTLFNRGHCAVELFGDRAELLIGNRDSKIDQGLTALQGGRRWDVVIDNSGYLPRHVRDSVKLLKGRAGRYVYVSTVAVYDPASGASFDESSPLRRMAEPQNEEAGLYYRPLAETAAATLEWWRAQTETRLAKVEGWPPPEKERDALAKLTAARG